MILVTGTSGFIGGHLLKRLIAVFGENNIVALTSKPQPDIRCIYHQDYLFESTFFKTHGLESIDVVIHAGAFTPKNSTQSNDWLKCSSNICNTLNLLKALPERVTKFIFLSTLDIYDNTAKITENSPISPISLYGDSKAYCEKLVKQWAHNENKIFQILRIGHVYGPGEEKYQKIIPNTIKRLLAGLHPQITGTGKDVRTFIFISDVIDAILKSLELHQYAGPINIVGEENITITELVQTLQKISGNTKEIEYISSGSAVRNMYFDNSKMRRMLTKEKYNLEKGLKEEWEYNLFLRK